MAFVLVSFVVLLSVFVTWEINSGPLGFDGLFYSKKIQIAFLIYLLIDWLIDDWLIEGESVLSLHHVDPGIELKWSDGAARICCGACGLSSFSSQSPALDVFCPWTWSAHFMSSSNGLTFNALGSLSLWMGHKAKKKNKHFPLQTSKQLFQHHVGTV